LLTPFGEVEDSEVIPESISPGAMATATV